MGLSRHQSRRGGGPGWRLVTRRWLLLCGLLVMGLLHHTALAGSCEEASLLLIHPTLAPPYDSLIDQLAEGMADAAHQVPGVCPLEALSLRAATQVPKTIVAVGAETYREVVGRFPRASVVPILVRTLPKPAAQGLSRFIDPALVLDQLRTLSPESHRLVFVHRLQVPAAWLRRAQAAAERRGLEWMPHAVSGLRETALAIEQIRDQADSTTAVWFHRDVLALDPDILVPPMVRLSWKIGIPVVSDDAETVERGLLFALAPDYRALGRAAVLHRKAAGLADIQWVRRILNRRTARAIGRVLPPSTERHFDVVYD